MDSVLDRLCRDSAVAILRLRSLGDCVLSTPALTILQNARPDLRIAVMVEDRFREIFDGLVPTIGPTLAELRNWRPALCLNLHGGSRSAWMTAFSGARYRAGFGHYRQQLAYNIRIPRAQEILQVDRKVHTAEHLASAMFYLGAPRVEIPAARLLASPAAASIPQPYAVIHPVAATAEKTWPAASFLDIADYLTQTGVTPVFIGAASDNLGAFQGHHVMQGASLTEIKNLLSRAALFVGNDSGPAHMAAAFHLPTVVMFGVSDSEIWAPWRTPSKVLGAPEGIAAIVPAQVREAIAAVVGQPSRPVVCEQL